MKIGIIGLGYMGGNMAARLQRAGFQLVVNDIDSKKAEVLIEGGARWADSPGRCATDVDVLITSLPGPPESARVMRDDGVLDALHEGAVWVDTTSNRRDLVIELAVEGARRGVRTVEAPVTGAVVGARTGRLTIFAGGTEETIDSVRPALDVLGRTIYCGPVGNGTVVKLVTNLLGFVNATALGEGLALGVKAGVDLATLWEAIKSSVGDSYIARNDTPSVFAGHYDPSFTVGLSFKDLNLTHDLAKEVGVPIPIGECARGRFGAACEAYGDRAGALHVVKLVEDAAGVSLRLDGDWPIPWEA